MALVKLFLILLVLEEILLLIQTRIFHVNFKILRKEKNITYKKIMEEYLSS